MTVKRILFIAVLTATGLGAILWARSAHEASRPPALAPAATTPSGPEPRWWWSSDVGPPESAAIPVTEPAAAPMPELVAPGDRNEVRQAFGALSERQLSDGRHFIQFGTAEVRGLAQYDSFEIRLDPREAPVVGRVEKVSQFDGMKRVSGKLLGGKGHDQEDVFSMTVSSDGSYAVGNFSREGRSYSLESKHGAGWISNPAEGATSLHHSNADVAH